MKLSVNQLRLELADIQSSHLMLHTFFWGDFARAVNEETINYPLMASYYPSASILDNQTSIPITIVLADKIYTDYSNLNDVESDTLQYCRHIFNIMNKSKRWQLLGRVESCSVTKFIESNADICAGHIMTVNFMLRDSNSICDLPMSGYDFDQVIGSSCLPVQIYRNGVLVDTIESGGMYSYITDAFTYTIKNTALTTLYSGDVTSNLNVTIQDSTAVLKDTTGDIISTTNILAEGSQDIVAPDSVVNFKYEDDSPIVTRNYLSGSTQDLTLANNNATNSDASYSESVPYGETINLPDITINVQNTLGTTVNSTTSPSVQDVILNAPDATINIKKFGDGTIASIDVPSGTTANYSVADNAITVNGTNGFTIDATDPLNIVLSDGTSTVTPVSVTPNAGSHHVDIVLPTNSPTYSSAMLIKTGQTTSYATNDDGDLEKGRGSSFFTLVANNPFGNTNRFTDTLGGTTYANNIVIDWSTYNGSTVLGYRRTELNVTSGGWASCVSTCAALSFGGFTSGWRLANLNEWNNILNIEYTNPLGYTPFSSFAWTYSSHTSSSLKVAAASYSWGVQASGYQIGKDKTENSSCLAVRTFTVTGTTLS
jgi:hypothetical protein